MKSQSRQNFFKFLIAIFAGFALMTQLSCKEKVEACMDVTAVNWDASADKPCEDCCTYPSLTLSMSHQLGDTLVLYDSLYLDEMQNPFFITGIRYYLSDFRLISNDQAYWPTDSLEVELFTTGANSEMRIADNFALVSKSTNSSTIGAFRNTDLMIDNVVFSIGLNETVNMVDPISVAGGQPLAIDSDSMYQDRATGYIFAKIGIVSDTMTMDTTVYRITGNDNRMEMTFPLERNLVRGTNVVVPIKLDYREWFTGINFATDSQDSVKQKFVNNLTKAFFVEE